MYAVPMPGRRRRAEPLAPDERRRSIVTAVIPLLVEQGVSVTTRQMAEAAGIAEGTIFRVFPDKTALIHEALEHAMDPEPVCAALSRIQDDDPVEDQLARAGSILLSHLEQVIALVSILRSLPDRPGPGVPPYVEQANRAIGEALVGILERHRDRLRIEPSRAAVAFRTLVFSAAHPVFAGREKLTIDEIVGIVASGILTPQPEPIV